MPTTLALPLMTVEQFFELPEPTEDFTYELYFGELVKVGRPKRKQYDLQRRLRELMKALDQDQWLVDIEMPYGLTVSYDVRAADV